MFVSDIISTFIDQAIEGLKNDAQSKDQKIPVNSFRKEIGDEFGRLYSAHYMRYLILGRGPGKFPPPDKMLKFVQDNPQILESARQTYANITEEGLAYLIGRKIAREGTRIYRGEKEGIDLLGVIEANLPELLKDLARNQVLSIQTELKSVLK
jgi:ethanolamine ammonia-lyase small subunit